MNIGILSFISSENNYGQMLQCYALQTYLNNQGHNAFHVPYIPQAGGRSSIRSASSLIKYLRTYFDWQLVVNYLRKLRYSLDDSKRMFSAFKSQVLDLYGVEYHSINDLLADPPEADAYIAGSDQIWGTPLNDPNAAGWYLRFGDASVHRIAYAASIGRKLEEDELPVFERYISDLDAVGVREASAAALCRDLGVEARLNVDPTLLLGAKDYNALADVSEEPIPDKPYLFVYVLNVLYPRDMSWNKFECYASDAGLAVASVYSSGYFSAYPIIPNQEALLPAVPGWLNLLRNAQSVVTTSFHGVVFSIMFHRPFLVVLLRGKRSGGNDRVRTLLESVGLNSRIFDSQRGAAEQMEAPIDWEDVDKRLSKMRQSSADFLMNSLTG